MEQEQPSQEIFDDIKRCALEMWDTYDDAYGYATEKKDRIKDLENKGYNALYIVAMFDWVDQRKLLALVSDDSREYLEKFMTY